MNHCGRTRFQRLMVLLVTLCSFAILNVFTVHLPLWAADEKPDADSKVPQVTKSIPKDGADDVDPGLKEIRVTFDRDMAEGMSWTGSIPGDKKRKAKWIDKRTCLLPVVLEPDKEYQVGINSASFKIFRSADGVPVEPTEISFTTTKSDKGVPQIVKMQPENGVDDVDPSITELKVTFSVPMGTGMSWTGGGEKFPKSPAGKKAKWSSDGKACTLPVILEADHDYDLGINSANFKNFRSKKGVPVDPVVYSFHTAASKK